MDAPDDIPIVDEADLGQLSEREAAMMAESVELAEWEKQRILQAARAFHSGDFATLLGTGPKPSLRELKRGYFQLSKLLHPDRYWGKSLGSFGPLIERLFAAVSQFVKTASDSRSVIHPDSPANPKRRRAERYPYRVAVTVGGLGRGFRVFQTADIGPGGLFVAGRRLAERAELGQKVQLLLHPDQHPALVVEAVVAWTRPTEAARAAGLPVGAGLRIQSVNPKDATLFASLVQGLHQTSTRSPEVAPGSQPQARPARNRVARGSDYFDTATRIVGIDVGTTNLSVSALHEGRVRILPWSEGERAVPSIIAFPSRGEPIIGTAARQLWARNPTHAIASIKRLLGRPASDSDVATHLARSAYSHSIGPDGAPVIHMWNEPFAVTQLFSYLIDAARKNAERVLGANVDSAVMTVPVSFGPERIEQLRRAASMANLHIAELVEEPSAAAIACNDLSPLGGLVGVFDFGGGTFDFSVVEATGGDLEILTTAGDSWLGGDDLDQAVAEASADLFWRLHGVDLRHRLVEWQALVMAAEKAKRDLTEVDTTHMLVPEVLHTADGARNLRIRLNRDKVEAIWAPMIRRAIDTSLAALASIGKRPSDLTAVYLSGGTTHVPAVIRALRTRFPVPVQASANPELAVCLGAGARAARLEAQRRSLSRLHIVQ